MNSTLHEQIHQVNGLIAIKNIIQLTAITAQKHRVYGATSAADRAEYRLVTRLRHIDRTELASTPGYSPSQADRGVRAGVWSRRGNINNPSGRAMAHPYPIREIARQAGVSQATVDRVLNHRRGVRPSTVNDIRQAIADLTWSAASCGSTAGCS